jgi:hypothetical protein
MSEPQDDKGQELIEIEPDPPAPLTPAQEAAIAAKIGAAIAALDIRELIQDVVSDSLREMTRKRIARRGEKAT